MEQKNLIAVARKWWVVLLAAAIVGGLIARVFAAFLSPTYESTVRLLTGPTSADVNTLDAAGGLARTYSELATSQPQLQVVAKDLGLNVSPDRLAEDVQATSNDVTRIVAIRVRQPSAQGALDFAVRLGQRMVELSKADSNRDEEIVANLLRQESLAGLSDPQREQIRQAANAVLAEQRAPGSLTIIDPPRLADAPVAPQIPLIVLLGVLCAVALVGVLLVVRERASGTIDDTRDLAASTDAPSLGTVDGSAVRSGLVSEAAGGAAAREIRGLADQISYLTRDGSVRSIAFIGAERGLPSGSLAASIGVALGELRLGVVVVDADPEGRDITRAFGLEGQAGLTDFLATSERGAPNSAEILGVTVAEGVTVVPAGTVGAGHRRLYPRHVEEFVGILREDFDLVLIVPPALEEGPDALVWAEYADGSVIVAEQRASMTEEVARAATRVRALRVRIIGTILCGGRAIAGLGRLFPRAEPRRRGTGAVSSGALPQALPDGDAGQYHGVGTLPAGGDGPDGGHPADGSGEHETEPEARATQRPGQGGPDRPRRGR